MRQIVLAVQPFTSHCQFIKPFIIVTLLLVSQLGKSQYNIRCADFDSDQFPLKLDSVIIEKESISIIPDVGFQFNPETGIISLNSDVEGQFKVCYRVPSDLLDQPHFNRDIKKYDYIGNYTERPAQRSIDIEETELFRTPGLYKSGSISRGITVGNRQNLFVNSSLNLQLQGQLTDDLKINAVITDQNIPFQPEGNTQKLRDFDNVYIQLYNEKASLLVGDIAIQNREENSYFLKYYKNQQGIQVDYYTPLSGGWTTKSKASVGAAKGKFATTKVEAIEGVQGPYRLRGTEDERFIIILANSEKVYLDGKRLKRGFDQDYVIDYNLGEVTFNPSIIITRFSRIRIDFEYAQQGFPRSNLLLSQAFENRNVKFYIDFYREKDNQNSSLQNDFSAQDISQLSNLGDNVDGAVISGVNATGFIPERILYKQVDTLVSGSQVVVYVYSTDPDSATFLVNFTEVGQGNGDYILKTSSANGRIYEWTSPVNGISQGNYDPIIRITTPNKRQMGIFGSEVTIGKDIVLYQELAYSDHDRNLYSNLDDEDNIGMAWKGGFRTTEKSFAIWPQYKLSSSFSYEFDSKNFLPMDRFRSIDFDRDWSYIFPNDSAAATEHILAGDIQISKNHKNHAGYSISTRNRSGAVDGIQQKIILNKELGMFFYNGRHFLLDNQLLNTKSSWFRSFSEIGLDFNVLEAGYFYDLDQNKITDDTGGIINSAMYYEENGVFLRSGDSSKFHLSALAGLRRDKLPVNGELENHTDARRFQFNAIPINNVSHKIDLSLSYREVKDNIFSDKDDQNIQGRMRLLNHFFQNHIRNSFSYATSNSRELKREFIYTLVGAGQGTHTWRDENNDEAQDLNEFYEAINPDERNYIKLFVPTDDYVEAFQTIYQHTVDIKMPGSWRGGRYFLDKISRLSFQSNWNVNFRTTSDEYADRLNPFVSISDSSILFSRSNTRYTIFYNKALPGIGVVVNRIINKHKQLNFKGFELVEGDRWETNLRWNLSRSYQVDLNIIKGNRINTSDFLESRNFNIQEHQATGKFTWLLTPMTRVSILYTYGNKSNVLLEDSDESISKNEVGSEITWSKPSVGNLNASIKYLSLDFAGQQDTYLGYTLLEALQPGNNLKMEINWQQSLREGLQLTFHYFGRKSEKTSVIHSGTMQLTAFF